MHVRTCRRLSVCLVAKEGCVFWWPFLAKNLEACCSLMVYSKEKTLFEAAFLLRKIKGMNQGSLLSLFLFLDHYLKCLQA